MSHSIDNSYFTYSYLTCVIPKSIAVPILRCIHHWVQHRGVEWTVGRLKDLKTQYLHYVSGSDVTLVASHKDHTPKGCFRPLWGMDSVKVLRVLNIYTSVVLPKVTAKQRHKFTSALQTGDWNLCYPMTNCGIRLKEANYYYCHPFNWIRSSTRRAPILERQMHIKTVEESEMTFESVISVINVSPQMSAHVGRYISEYAKALYIAEDILRDALYKCNEPRSPVEFQYFPVGKIGEIQEKGAKLRTIANPFRHLQMVLYPLGSALLDVLRELPWDCTFEQQKGVQFVIDSLQNGKTVYSLDLANATDLFPLKIQREAVSSILTVSTLKGPVGPRGSSVKTRISSAPADLLMGLDIFCDIARGDWSYQTSFVNWNKGQPLGLYPSFAMFALTHGILVRNIEKKLGVTNTFRILGDDIVINDPNVARHYREDMEYLGCKFSEAKCLVSNTIGEFAGMVISKQGVIPASKYRPYNGTDVLGPLISLGLKGSKFIPPSLRRKVLALASAPEPVGLGWNPKGISLDKRMPPELIDWWFSSFDKCIPSDFKLSVSDRKVELISIWSRTELEYNSALMEYVPKKSCIKTPFPLDRREIVPDRLIIDHVKAVNSSRVYPEDVKLDVPDYVPVPLRGRTPVVDALRAGMSRLRTYYKKYKEADVKIDL